MALLPLLDHLYCKEGNLELDAEDDAPTEPMPPPLPSPTPADDEWAEVLCSLATRERQRAVLVSASAGEYYLRSARKEAVAWVEATAARRDFSAVTVALAVDYLDRCFAGGLLRLEGGKPWMGRLAAVACLSLAAKVEETAVILPVDLQAAIVPEEGGGYLFDPQTIRRMELLVLSALGWRMNPVTPLSFIHHLLLRLRPKAGRIAARLRWIATRCDGILLSVIADRRWVQHPASVWAAAALLEAAAESGAADQASGLISLLEAPKNKVEECYHIMQNATEPGAVGRKRKLPRTAYSHDPSPVSTIGVVGLCFSCESSPPLSQTLEVAMNEAFGEDEGRSGEEDAESVAV